jgi:hypothetical protein
MKRPHRLVYLLLQELSLILGVTIVTTIGVIATDTNIMSIPVLLINIVFIVMGVVVMVWQDTRDYRQNKEIKRGFLFSALMRGLLSWAIVPVRIMTYTTTVVRTKHTTMNLIAGFAGTVWGGAALRILVAELIGRNRFDPIIVVFYWFGFMMFIYQQIRLHQKGNNKEQTLTSFLLGLIAPYWIISGLRSYTPDETE